MSMIDHDDQDRLRAQSAADLDARRYRRHSDATVWRVLSQERRPDGAYTLGGPGACESMLIVSAAELARAFTRCDAGAPAPLPMPRIPRPEELLPKPVDHTAAIAARTTEAIAQLTASQGQTASVTDDIPVVNGVADAMRAAGWSVGIVPNRDGRTATAHITAPCPIDPKLFR